MSEKCDELMEEMLKEIKGVKDAVKETVKVMTDIKNLFEKYDVEEVINDEELREG